MDDTNGTPLIDLAGITSNIVSAYVSHNSVQASDLPALITSIHGALDGLGKPSTLSQPAVERASPAEIRRSIKPDGLVSFIDGKSYKTLKRHLATAGLDPASYRAKFGLPADYPMVAASYAAQRSELAKALGLGQVRRNGGKATDAAADRLDEMPQTLVESGKAREAATKKRGGRPRKAQAA